MRGGASVADAASGALLSLEALFGADKAGLIAIDHRGRMAFPFHTQGMGRAALWDGASAPRVAVWPEDGLTRVD